MSLATLAWLAATTAPLYRGGHFVFHSSIAEEIWKGRFLLYYLPYPGSMLSQQAQWGNVIVPHPALYHTLAAPLAALPHAAFFVAEKVLLALLLAAMVWACAALAAAYHRTAAAILRVGPLDAQIAVDRSRLHLGARRARAQADQQRRQYHRAHASRESPHHRASCHSHPRIQRASGDLSRTGPLLSYRP